MSEGFGAAAARLSGRAALLFGWRPADFWNATPEELRTMLIAMTPDDAADPIDTETLAQMIARDEGQDNG